MEDFKDICSWLYDLNYIEDMPRATRFIPENGIRAQNLTRLFLDRIEVDDVTFSPFDNHHQTN